MHLIEERLEHPNLLYKGIVDCVAKFNRTNTLVDWKTSEKVKDTVTKLYDAPIQTVAYLGMCVFKYRILNYNHNYDY